MSQDQAQGKGEQFTARIKQEWGKLTDDEVGQAEGNIDEIIALLQEKYGDARETIAAKINQLKERFDNEKQ